MLYNNTPDFNVHDFHQFSSNGTTRSMNNDTIYEKLIQFPDTPNTLKDLAEDASKHPEHRHVIVWALAYIKNTSIDSADLILDRAQEQYEEREGVREAANRKIDLAETPIDNPAELLPSRAQELVESTARTMGHKPGVLTYTLCTTAASLLGSFVRVNTQQNNSQPLPCNLNTLIGGRSSDGKSAPILCVINPLVLASQNELMKFNEAVRELKRQHKSKNQNKTNDKTTGDKVKNDMASTSADLTATNNTHDVESLEDKKHHLSNSRNRKILKIDGSFSAEGMISRVTSESPLNGLTLFFDEGRGLLSSERYNGQNKNTVNPFSQMILSGHNVPLSGAAATKVNEDESKYFRDQSVSVIMGIQYGVINRVFSPDDDSEGTLTRFTMICTEASDEKLSRAERRSKNGTAAFNSYFTEWLMPFADDIKTTAPKNHPRLEPKDPTDDLDFTPENIKDLRPAPLLLEFSDDAQAHYEASLDRVDDYIEELREHHGCGNAVDIPLVAKLRKAGIYIGKYALILHFLDNAETLFCQPKRNKHRDHHAARNMLDTPITLDVIERATKLWWFEVAHFSRILDEAFKARINQEQQNKQEHKCQQYKAILNRIKDKKRISHAKLKDSMKGVAGLKRSDIEPLVEQLLEDGHIRRDTSSSNHGNSKGMLVFVRD